jgi:hypothetical protein
MTVECSLMPWRDNACILLGVLCALLMALSEARFLLAVPHFDEISLATYDSVAKVALEVVAVG